MDEALPEEQLEAIKSVLANYRRLGLGFQALRTRQAGRQAFISLHVLVPGEWTVRRGHDEVETMEANIRAVVQFSNLTTHLEPIEDPLSLVDEALERNEATKELKVLSK